MAAQLNVAVVGATGYAGFELARLLAKHPHVSQTLLMSRDGAAEQSLSDIYPQSLGAAQTIEPFSWERLVDAGTAVLFLATPHEASWELAPQALERGVKVIDLSGAWRLKDEQNRAVYGLAHVNGSRALLERTIYGLPELHPGRSAGASFVANPGCYATSIILALAPLVQAGLLDLGAGIVCDAKSGVSGAGKQPTAKTHFVAVADNLSAYSVFGHRHTGEILEQLGLQSRDLTFAPHLLPIPRGILSTIYARTKQPATSEQVADCFHSAYAGCAWIRLFPAGTLPQIQYCLHTNYCDIGFALSPDGRRLILVSCLDNLMKGAAGQAVQNLNAMYGFDEREGLQ